MHYISVLLLAKSKKTFKTAAQAAEETDKLIAAQSKRERALAGLREVNLCLGGDDLQMDSAGHVLGDW